MIYSLEERFLFNKVPTFERPGCWCSRPADQVSALVSISPASCGIDTPCVCCLESGVQWLGFVVLKPSTILPVNITIKSIRAMRDGVVH